MSAGSRKGAQRPDSRLSGPHRAQDRLQGAKEFTGAHREEHGRSPAKVPSCCCCGGGGGDSGAQPDLERRPGAVGPAVPPVPGHLQRQGRGGVPEPLRGVRQTMNQGHKRTVRWRGQPCAAGASVRRLLPASGGGGRSYTSNFQTNCTLLMFFFFLNNSGLDSFISLFWI